MGSGRPRTVTAVTRLIYAGLALVGAAAVTAAGCGGDRAPASSAPRSSALLPDGTVPWIDDPVSEQEIAPLDPNRARPSPDEARDVEACEAGALSGELERRARKLQRDDFGKVIGDNGGGRLQGAFELTIS